MGRKRLSKSLFEPQRGVGEEQTYGGVSNKGYFAEAFYRLFRMRPAAVALGIIVFIMLFSVIAPIFIPKAGENMDPYYAKMSPRIGTVGGVRDRRLGERGIVRLAAIGVGTLDKSGAGDKSIASGAVSEYAPLLSWGRADGPLVYDTRVDSYLEVGFVYKSVSPEEYLAMMEWEEKTGLPLLYPLIADNEYTADRLDANVWYKVGDGGVPIGVGGETVKSFDEDVILADNYMRNESGEPVYFAYSGGGNYDTALYRVRVLYYNYYRYVNGSAPSFIFGTDSQGYDLALRMAGGIRLSLLIAFTVSAINFVIGALVGSVEGYYGGAVDLLLERVTDVLSGVPFIVVATLFQIYLAGRVGAIPSLLFAFVLTGWLGTANRVRGQFYRFKGAEYVLAARTLGASDRRIIWRHIFPNTLGTLITASALVIPGVIFSESMLSFLGIMNLGGEGITSLGTLLSEAGGIWTSYPHLILFPALVISLLMISFNIFGNCLRDAFDPREGRRA